jgi:hypothetical protein
LRPVKQDLIPVRWLVANKPQVAFFTHQFVFHRPELRLIYCLRNPLALFHSRFASMSAVGEEHYGEPPAWDALAASVALEYRVSLAAFAQAYDPALDCAVNLESFAAHLDDNLTLIWGALGVSPLPAAELQTLEVCEECGTRLEITVGPVGPRHEERLYCPHCQRAYIGPGNYNYIRQVDPERLASWQQKPHAEALIEIFTPILGRKLIDYFTTDAYLKPGSHLRFQGLFDKLMSRLNI